MHAGQIMLLASYSVFVYATCKVFCVLNPLQPARPKSTWAERAAVDLPPPIGFSNCAFRKMVGFCWNTALSEVSDLSSRGHFVDLGQENTSV